MGSKSAKTAAESIWRTKITTGVAGYTWENGVVNSGGAVVNKTKTSPAVSTHSMSLKRMKKWWTKI